MNYRFTTAALTQAPGATAAQVDTQLSSTHGSGLWGGAGGTGTNEVAIVSATAGGLRIPSVNVQVKNISGTVIAQATTDANGDATVNIDDATYDFVAAKAQYTMSTTRQIIPTGGLTVTILGVAVTTTAATLPTTTVLDIISRALRLLTVQATNENPDAPEAQDALRVLNSMIYQWNNEKLALYAMKTELFAVVSGTGAYTIGDGGTWDTTRPQKIENMFLRDTSSGSNLDFKLEIINNDRYQEIFQKALASTYPRYVFYQADYPLGTINFWPVPSKTMSCGVSQWSLLTAFTGLTDLIILPPGYEMALGYALAYHLALEYAVDPRKYEKQMLEAKENIGKVNTDVLLMSTDSANLPRTAYNIYLDSYAGR
jgi:hypothetical protein